MSCAVVRWPGILEQREQRQQQEDDDHPEGEIAQIGVHPVSFMAVGGPAALLHYAASKLSGRFTSVPRYNLGAGRAPAKGTATCNPSSHSTAVWPEPRLPYLPVVKAERTAPVGRAGARSTTSRPAVRVTSAPANVRRNRKVSRRDARLGARQRLVERLELAELDRPLVAGMRDRAAEQAQRHFRGQAGEFFGIEDDRTAIGPRRLATTPPPRRATAVSIAASARRSRRASSARRRASSPSRASAGITSRSRARVKRGSRFDGSSAKCDPGARERRESRAFGMSSSGRTSMISALRRYRRGSGDDRAPWRRAR